jgi:DNA-binding MarR family transcriptional regulator
MTKQQYIEQLFNTLGQLKKLLENHSHISHEDRAATIMQYSALKFLSNTKNSTVGDLAKYLNLSKSSSTQLIERLVKCGLVKRIDDQLDRRIVHVTITPEGEQHILALKKKYLERIGKIFSKIPDADLKELIRIHTDLINTLQKDLKS